MSPLFTAIVIILAILAVMGLVVGVANDAILDRHVKVNADENALSVDIDVADGLLGKGHVCFYLSYVSASHYGRRFLIKRARP